jgi:hypothetical protein
VSTSNPFAAYYANPRAAGLPSGSSRAAFGSPLYATTTSTTTPTSTLGTAGGRLTTPGLGGTGLYGSGFTGGSPTSFSGSSSSGSRRAPAYTATLGFSYQPATPSRLQTDIQQMLANSTALTASRNIQVSVKGSTVVLQGRAADEHDRRLAESLVRLTPGVRDVQNNIEVGQATASR